MKIHALHPFKAGQWLLTLCLLMGFAWLWACFCTYPFHTWNAIRFAPAVMEWHGFNPYPGPHEGPLTTWIYGPVPLLGMGPAALMPGVISSMLMSDAINLFLVAGSLVWAIHRMAPANANRGDKIWACLIAIAAMQHTNFIFLQVDNWVTACGFIMLGLIGRETRLTTGKLWLTAAISTAALWCKPTALGPVLGLIVWVGLQSGWREGVRQTGRCVVCGGLIGLFCFQIFEPAGMVFNMFVIPSRIPSTNAWAKMIGPIYLSGVTAYFFAPITLLILGWFHKGKPGVKTFSAAAWMFWMSIPLNLAGFAIIGGNLNSLHGVNFLLPGLALGVLSLEVHNRTMIEYLRAAAFTGLLLFQVSEANHLALTPQTAALHQGLALAKELPGAVYFPWNPLFNFEISGRFDHAEDGIMTRYVAGQSVNLAQLHQYLPSELCVIARKSGDHRSPLIELLAPANAREDSFGAWNLTHWPPFQASQIPGAARSKS